MSNKVFSGDFLKVLLALKESIMKDIHCSELAIIKEVYTNNCNCSLLSNPETGGMIAAPEIDEDFTKCR